MHCMIPLEKVLLRLRRRWALILPLASGTNVPNVVRKDCCRISLRDWLIMSTTLVLRGRSRVNLWHRYVDHNETAPLVPGHSKGYRRRVGGNLQHIRRPDGRLDVIVGSCWFLFLSLCGLLFRSIATTHRSNWVHSSIVVIVCSVAIAHSIVMLTPPLFAPLLSLHARCRHWSAIACCVWSLRLSSLHCSRHYRH